MQLTQPVRYAVSSALTWGVDVVVFVLLWRLAGIPLALLLSRIAAGIAGFVSHKLFSFRARTRVSRGEIVRYFILAATNYLLSVVLLLALTNPDSLMTGAIKLGVDVLVFAVNYFVMKKIFGVRGEAGAPVA